MDYIWVKNNLTRRQREFVASLASGRNTDEIAEEFDVSQFTVRNTITNAKERVGATSTNNLIALAVSNGWVYQRNTSKPPYFFAPKLKIR